MSWALKGLAAPLKDKVFNLKAGMTLGRQGDIVVPDTKSSSIHARIVVLDGRWWLADNSSKNGTRINGQRIESAVQLKAGLKFFIGDQGFEVLEIKQLEPEITAPPIARVNVDDLPTPPPAPRVKERTKQRPPTFPAEDQTPPPGPRDPDATVVKAAPVDAPDAELGPVPNSSRSPGAGTPAAAPPLPRKRRYWHEILAGFVEKNQENFSESKRPVTALTPALILEFVRGVQASSKWTLGYGPRKIGPSALDLPIWEPGAPAVCFEIFTTSDGIMFKTAHPKLVTVNGEALDSHVLHVGDKIRIGETIIEVDFET